MFGFIGIKENVVFKAILMGCLIPSNLYAANPYQLGAVDYFQEKSVEQPLEDQEIDWREPVISADGRTSYYTPPPAMLTLLEDPTLDHARAYLDWQKTKVAKIVKAQEAIDQVLKEEEEE